MKKREPDATDGVILENTCAAGWIAAITGNRKIRDVKSEALLFLSGSTWLLRINFSALRYRTFGPATRGPDPFKIVHKTND